MFWNSDKSEPTESKGSKVGTCIVNSSKPCSVVSFDLLGKLFFFLSSNDLEKNYNDFSAECLSKNLLIK